MDVVISKDRVPIRLTERWFHIVDDDLAGYYDQVLETVGDPDLILQGYGGALIASRLAKARLGFAFESTLSGLVYLGRLKRWKASGYRIEIIYLRLSSPQLGLRRIAARVKQGGHPGSTCCAGLTAAGPISKMRTAL